MVMEMVDVVETTLVLARRLGPEAAGSTNQQKEKCRKKNFGTKLKKCCNA
jgi:hypothetical protein